MKSSQQNLEKQVEELKKENHDLLKYKILVDQQTYGAGTLGKFATLVWIGPNLSLAFKNWFEAKSDDVNHVPWTETAELLAAFVRRFVRVGIIMAVLALIPSILLLWQNFIMKDQYAALIRQIEAQRTSDINQQITQYFPLLLDKDRGRFWSAVSFFSSNPSITKEAQNRLSRLLVEGEGKGACAALEALARLTPLEGTILDGMLIRDVTKAVKSQLNLGKLSLSGIEIRKLNCPNLQLRQAGISEMSFSEAKLSNLSFSYVDLAGSRFNKSDLRGAKFTSVQFCSEKAGRCTDFSDSDLRSAYFNGGSKIVLNDAKLQGTRFKWGDGLTKMPTRYFKNAICLRPNPAEQCYAFHKSNLAGKKPKVDLPDGCPEIILGPIIHVIGFDTSSCKRWLATAN